MVAIRVHESAVCSQHGAAQPASPGKWEHGRLLTVPGLCSASSVRPQWVKFTDGYEMMPRAWSSIAEMPYCFSKVIHQILRQGWVSSGRNLYIFLQGHLEKSGRNLFLPVLSGQNWKQLNKTGKNCERCQKWWKKIIVLLNFLQKIMVTNACV